MNCLQEAFKQAGINLRLKPWFQIDNMQELCNFLGLRWYEGTDLELGVEPVIVIYKASPGKAHAEYTEDVGPYLNRKIIGIIRLTPQP